MRDDAGCVGIWRDALFEVWAAPAGEDVIKARADVTLALMRSLPAGHKLVAITLVQERAIRVVDREAREAIDEKVKQAAPYTKGSATVIDASGFKAAVIRSISAALMMLSGVKYPAKTDGELLPALRWAAELLDPVEGGAIDADALAAAFDAFLVLAAEEAPKVPAREDA